jgi:hypothetical protein
MKQGKTLQELAMELTRIQNSKRDYIVPVASMGMVHDENVTSLEFRDNGARFQPSKWAHQQIASYTDVPKQYYDRILSQNPTLLTSCVNHGFQMAINNALIERKRSKGKHESRMIRTIDGSVRGFLSDRYRRLDSYDLFETVYPVIEDKGFSVTSSDITEKNFYLKVLTDKIQGEVIPGHVVQYGLMVSSSDVGAGSVKIEPLMFELVCKNGMVMEQSMRKYHIGKSDTGDSTRELLSDSTKELADKAFWAEVRDVLIGTMRQDEFDFSLNKLREAAKIPIKNMDIPKVVELSMKSTGVSGEKTKGRIIEYLLSGAHGRGMNLWSLANGFTYASQAEEADFDESVELDRAAGKLIELPRTQLKFLD